MARSSAAETAAASALVFAALGDEQRLRLVTRLSEEGPLSIADLSAEASVTRQAVTKHLHVLEEAGLVRGSREGRLRIWSLERKRLQKAQEHLQAISRHWDNALDRLKNFVEH
jgi:DNA-binding transcriptional ArsR family regulator